MKKTKPSDTVLLLRRALKLAKASRETSFVVISMGHGSTIDAAGPSTQPVIAARAQHAVGKLLWELGAVGSLVPPPPPSNTRGMTFQWAPAPTTKQLKAAIKMTRMETRKAARRIRKS